jgi:hypothetical protein
MKYFADNLGFSLIYSVSEPGPGFADEDALGGAPILIFSATILIQAN